MLKASPPGKNMILFLLLAVLVVGAFSALFASLPRAAGTSAPSPGPSAVSAPSEEPQGATLAVSAGETAETAEERRGRREKVYTIILAGLDEVSGNTDTILIGRLDAQERRIDFVSIPRDTYVNLPWDVRKINCVYTASKNAGESGLEGLRGAVCGLCGFQADCCAVLDIDTVKSAIDLMGGVYFDVPFDMDYEDAAQGLSIHIPAGYQCLNGEQCVQLCRYRKNYVNGDLDRITMQHDFLRAAARQFISLGAIPNLARVVQLAAGSLDSDLTAANIAFFLRCAIQCRAEDLSFHTMPNRPADAGGLSYTFVEKDAWLTLLNEALNPFEEEIREENLDIVFPEGGGFRSSTGTIRGAAYLRQ